MTNSIVVFLDNCSFLFQFLLYPLCPWSSNESFYFCIVPLPLWLSLHSHALDIAYPIAVVFCIGIFRCFSYSFSVFSCFIHDFVCSITIVCYENCSVSAKCWIYYVKAYCLQGNYCDLKDIKKHKAFEFWISWFATFYSRFFLICLIVFVSTMEITRNMFYRLSQWPCKSTCYLV